MRCPVKRRVLIALAGGAPRDASRVREESQCSEQDLLDIASRGFVRFRTEETGALKVCVTPKGAEYLMKHAAKA